MHDVGWPVDSTPNTRMPVYTRLNATDVLPDPVSPLGATLVWDRYIERGWAVGDVDDGCFDMSEIAEPSAAAGIFYGHLYVNMSASRLYGIRAGIGTDNVDAIWYGSHPDAPAHVPQEGDVNPSRTATLAEFSHWVMTTKTFPALEEQTALANVLRTERPDLSVLTNWGLLTRTRTVLPLETYAWIGHSQTTKGTGAGPGLLYALGVDPSIVLTLIGPASDVDSATPAFDLWELSRQVKSDATLTTLFGTVDSGLLERLRVQAPAFAKQFDNFLDRQGFRGPNEWDLGAPSWETNPELPLSLIERLRHTDDSKNPATRRQESARASALALEQVLAQFPDPDVQAQIHQALASARRFFAWRERSKCNCIKVLHEARMPLIELGRRLAADGKIKKPGHVFNAVAEELDQLVAQPETLTEVLAARDEVRRELATVALPTFLIGTEARPEWRQLPKRGGTACTEVSVGDVLVGGPGAPGVVQGRVRVVHSTSSIEAFQPGEILVAPQTDPSWTPLFMVSAGVIVDVGSMVSHAMIVSRELGVPCVGGITDGIRRLPDGALVEVDGSAGTVTVLELP